MTELVYEASDAVPEGLREFATEKDGKFIVAVAPKVRVDELKTKVDEFRTNNIKAKEERDALKAERDGLVERVGKYASVIGEDFDAFVTDLGGLRETKKLVDDGKLVASSSLEEALNQRTNDMRKDYETKLVAATKDVEKWQSEATKLAQKYNSSTVERAIRDAIIDPAVGARADATPDILKRAMEIFTLDEGGAVVPMKDGKVVYGADANPMTPKEYLTKLREEAPYFFMDSSGGGAGGGKKTEETTLDIGNMSMSDYVRLRNEGKIR